MAGNDPKDASRRDFLRTATGALLASPLAARAASAQVPDIALPELPGEKVGWAIVGLGSLAINQILPALPKCSRARLSALVSGRPEKAKHLAKYYGLAEKNVYSYDTFDQIAKNPDIGAVYIVLPNSMHPEYTIRALKAGKHVLCEKPMANTPAECEQMIAAAKAANRKLMIGYRLHYEPYNQALVKLARETPELGPTQVILADAGFNIGDPGQWRLKKAMAGGGSLMDIGIYALQAARYCSGEEPTEVNAMTWSSPNDVRFKEVEEHVTFQLRFPSGILANCTSSYGGGLNRWRVVKPNALGGAGAGAQLLGPEAARVQERRRRRARRARRRPLRHRDGPLLPVHPDERGPEDAGRRGAARPEDHDVHLRGGEQREDGEAVLAGPRA